MAEEQKPITVAETAPVVAEPVVEPVATEATPVEVKPVEETAAVEAPTETTEETPAAATTEEVKEEVKPIEAGTLEHKGAPANFPKNLLYAKNHFWFGTDSVEKEKLATYLKNEKATDVAHHVVSWATETGKGLLFYGKEADKSTPTGVIQLAEASEPTVDGTNKFHFTAKGHKHAFKAPNATERDAWVEQLKAKIAEAKELAVAVTESETYKNTLESLKPAKKEEKPVVAEAPKEEVGPETAEEAKEEEEEEEKKEEKKEEPKRRSASRKRASIFGTLLGKKEEAKKEVASEDKPAEEAAATEPTPIEQLIQATEDAQAEGAVADAPATEETKETKEPVKPTPTKRASIFGSLSFGKKKAEAESPAATPAKEETAVTSEEPVAETAPVIPAVETTEPLSTDVSSPATVPTETTEVAANGESKKEVKGEKRKSSLPFAFGKKDKVEKSATSDEEGEKKSSNPFFSKLRQTVKKTKPAEKPADKAEETPAEVAAEPATEATVEPTAEATKAEEQAEAAAPVAEETAAEKPAAPVTAPVVAAA
ncbi:Pleckstrin homology domain-containing protein [Poronia punctata]|nr:Pleckstrin homology domain-containing protein [Poronia punctata]